MYMINNNVVVVIPIYKQKPDIYETASFRQCLNILRNYDIFIVTYKELNCSLYSKTAEEYNHKLYFEYFDKIYFSSVGGYNRLCLSKEFYERFQSFEYMLIYQLDAWVFRDELSRWCSKGYDFIGAPWFIENNGCYTYRMLGSVGNGGFSLRRISFCLDALNYPKFVPIMKIAGLLKMSQRKKIDYIKAFIKALGYNNNLYSLIDKDVNEDYIFSCFKYSYHKCFIPCPNDAIGFSFEVHPSYLYKLNGNKFPFGCHAFMKNEYDIFWQNYIVF